jgi:hypothetical protein
MAMGETANAVIAPVKSTERTALSRALFSGFMFVPSLVIAQAGIVPFLRDHVARDG